MILYFADRKMNIKGQASSNLRKGFKIKTDLKAEDVESGVASFECRIGYEKADRAALEEMTNAGNYLLRSHENENEFYTIIDSELDTKNQEVYIYAEDAGLDLLNEVALPFSADKAYPITSYINKWINDSGFEIGKNEVPSSSSRKLKWEGESTVTERLASIATQFGNYEISYSYEIKGLFVTRKLVNIHKKRGKDTGEQLRLDKEVDRIITKKSVANIATAFSCTGGTPENSETPITLKGYKYDDGDFYVGTDGILRSRKANKKWSRYIWNKEPNKKTNAAGYICKSYSYDTLSQATLCSHAITELKKVCDMEINFEIDIKKLPEGVKIGDRLNVIDDAGELYLYTRLLQVKTSVTDKEKTATLGEHLIKDGGISQKVIDLAEQFAKMTVSVSRATAIAENAKGIAEGAASQATEALNEASEALGVAAEAQSAANTATQSAASAEALAQAAQAAVDKVEENISSLETTVTEAQNAANNAQQAATTATEKAEEAETAANNAVKDASEAKTAAGAAQNSAASAISKADEAIGTANTAKSEAQAAADTAAAAKLDAEQAKKDVADFEANLETLEQTMTADYARKTELTKTAASLQTQITQNAGEISSTAQKVLELDETANNAASQAQQAQNTAASAQSKAEQATAEAEAAQTAADEAKAAAQSAQSEADTAKAAAATAQSVADKAKTDLEAAKADLETVQGRVDATEEEIAAAQQAVTAAQTAADKAQEDADTAAQQAANAQSVANTAAENATNAQSVANNAASQASLAQQVANEAKGNAEQAQTIANQAAATATEAKNTANTAKANAENAQSVANQAASDAAAAQQAADDAEAKAQQAATDLAAAQQNLAAVTARVGATEEEVAAAQAAVEAAQAAANTAKANAATAQSTADTAKANAAAAQTAANNAKTAADNAQAAADEAQAAADKAQADVEALAVRVTTAETSIRQNSEQIELRAKKTEVVQYINDIDIGGRNLLINTGGGGSVSIADGKMACASVTSWTNDGVLTLNCSTTGLEVYYRFMNPSESTDNLYGLIPGKEYTLSGKAKVTTTSGALERLTVRTQANIQGGGWTGGVNKNILTEDSADWVNFAVTFKIEATAKGYYVSLQLYYTGSWQGVIELKELKLEKGNKATDWTLAPEETATREDVTSLESSFTVEAEAIKSEVSSVKESVNENGEEIEKANSLLEQLADSIKSLVVGKNGESLMTQTDKGWTFDFATILEEIQNNTDRVAQYDDRIKLDTFVNENGETEPSIVFSESSTDFKVIITNKRILFQEGGQTPTYIYDNTLVTENIEVKQEFRQGGWVQEIRNKCLCLVWKGVSE